MVRSSMMKLNNKELVEQIEEKVGSDLQYIRLNGTVVGIVIAVLKLLLDTNFITLINKLTRSRVHKTKKE
jgi:uncharacterized membrane-anchored protein YjiN (DUF445 family)